MSSPDLFKIQSKKNIMLFKSPSQSNSQLNFEQTHEYDNKGGLVFTTKVNCDNKKWAKPDKAIEPKWWVRDPKFNHFNMTRSDSKPKKSSLCNSDSPFIRHVRHSSNNINIQSGKEVESLMDSMAKIKEEHRKSTDKIS